MQPRRIAGGDVNAHVVKKCRNRGLERNIARLDREPGPSVERRAALASWRLFGREDDGRMLAAVPVRQPYVAERRRLAASVPVGLLAEIEPQILRREQLEIRPAILADEFVQDYNLAKAAAEDHREISVHPLDGNMDLLAADAQPRRQLGLVARLPFLACLGGLLQALLHHLRKTTDQPPIVVIAHRRCPLQRSSNIARIAS